jgi:hypothetical protein
MPKGSMSQPVASSNISAPAIPRQLLVDEQLLLKTKVLVVEEKGEKDRLNEST